MFLFSISFHPKEGRDAKAEEENVRQGIKFPGFHPKMVRFAFFKTWKCWEV